MTCSDAQIRQIAYALRQDFRDPYTVAEALANRGGPLGDVYKRVLACLHEQDYNEQTYEHLPFLNP